MLSKFKKKFAFALVLCLFTLITAYATAWVVSDAEYEKTSTVSIDKATDVSFKPDGTKMYVLGGDNPSSVYQYDLSSAWDIATASYVGAHNFSSSNSWYWGQAIYIKSDGTKIYFVSSFSDEVEQLSFGTAWDITSLSDDAKTLDISGQDSEPSGLFFKDDGTKMYLAGNAGDDIDQYTLSTPWDLATASYDSVEKDLWNAAPSFSSTQGVTFKDDGTKMYAIGSSTDKVAQFSLSPAWDLSTASFDSVEKSVSSQAGYPTGVFFGDSGAKMYVTDYTNDKVYQYALTDVVSPTVSTLSPADDATGVATDSNLVITFSEAVDAESGNIDLYKSDDTLIEEFDVTSEISGSGTTTITINPTSDLDEQTSYYVQIDATAFDDAASNSYAGIADETTWTFTTADETNPTVITLSPLDDATGVSPTANLVVTFAEAVDVESGNITIKKASDDSTVESIDVTGGNVSGTGTTTITINPATELDEETAYYVQIAATAFDDPSSNSYAGINDSTSWSFTTGDVTSPTVSTLSPADNAVDVAIDSNLVITFSEVVDVETGNIVIYDSSNAVFETIDVAGALVTGTGTTTITINPTTDLTNGVEFYVQIASTAFDDPSSNSYTGITDTTTWSFTTVEAEVVLADESGGGNPFIVIQPQSVQDHFSSLEEQVAVEEWTDVTEAKNLTAIEYLLEKGVVEGYEDGEFKPERGINRAEFMKILVETKFPGEAQGSNCFLDVTDQWFAPYICFAKEREIVMGYEDGNFMPSQEITLEEMLKVVLLSYGMSVEEDIELWYMNYYNEADAMELLELIYTEVGEVITRGEAAQMIYNIEQYLNE